MTTMIDWFFCIPQSVVRCGLVKELSPVALRLLVVLWHESEYHRTRKYQRTDGACRLFTQLSFKSASRISPCQVGSRTLRIPGVCLLSNILCCGSEDSCTRLLFLFRTVAVRPL